MQIVILSWSASERKWPNCEAESLRHLVLDILMVGFFSSLLLLMNNSYFMQQLYLFVLTCVKILSDEWPVGTVQNSQKNGSWTSLNATNYCTKLWHFRYSFMPWPYILWIVSMQLFSANQNIVKSLQIQWLYPEYSSALMPCTKGDKDLLK